MEIKAYIKNVHSTPSKLRVLVPAVKKAGPLGSLDLLFYTTKKSAQVLRKAVKSAIDNAKSAFNIDPHLLQFKTLTIEEGTSLRRYRAGGRGTAKPFRKQYSHIKVVLSVLEVTKKKKSLSVDKEEPKKESVEKKKDGKADTLSVEKKPEVKRKVSTRKVKNGTKS